MHIQYNEEIEKIRTSEDFYFQKLKDLWQEFIDFKINDIDLFINEIRTNWQKTTGNNDTSRAKQLVESFNNETKKEILELINKMITVFDRHGADRVELNPYDDRRSIANSLIRQNHWIINILKYKNNSRVTSSINNAIAYIENPNNILSIYLDEHRQKISENLLNKPYEEDTFVADLEQWFKKKDINTDTKNPENKTLFMTRILYECLKYKWDPSPIRPKSNQPLNQILYGPPGTGKTYKAIEIASNILGNEKSSITKLKECYTKQVEFITFHQSFSYENFIEGLKAKTKEGKITYEIEDGIFKNICKEAEENNSQNYVLIIDEINRGNISQIFGELISLIEDNKRSGNEEPLSIKLPYSKDDFAVPNNLYIIGTMNTADRSLTLLDTAFRRRFEFKEMLSDTEKISKEIDDIDLKKLLNAINKRIEFLYDKEHQIGHSYFMKIEDLEGLQNVFATKILPLLEEYFFEDRGKIVTVLQDNNNFYQLINPPAGLDTEDKKIYHRNEKLRFSKEAFINIYTSNQANNE